MRRLCQKIIWQHEGRSNTYCMREEGHPGKCNLENCEPKEEKKGVENATR